MKVVFAVCLFTACVASGLGDTVWTSWLNRDSPEETGDWETYWSFAVRDGKPPCEDGFKPVDAECRVKESGMIWYEANQIMHRGCSLKGLACKNADQSDGRQCEDYEIRFLCYKPDEEKVEEEEEEEEEIEE